MHYYLVHTFSSFRRFIQRYNMKQHIKTHRIELLNENGAKNIMESNADGMSEDEEPQRMSFQPSNLPSFLEHQERGLNMTQ